MKLLSYARRALGDGPRLVVIGLVGVLVAYGSTKVRDQIITNSTLDSSIIGGTVPAAADFTHATVHGQPSNPSLNNSGAMGWNATGGGETDFVNNHGTGNLGGFSWYDSATSAWSSTAPLLRVDKSGNVTASTSITSPAINASSSMSAPAINASTSMTTPTMTASNAVYGGLVGATASNWSTALPQGSYTLWNASGAFGETDFVNSRGGAVGGFRWYLNATGAGLTGPTMYMDQTGALTVPSLNSNLNGNASTASNFNHTPGGCGAGNAGSAIDASGNALGCTHIAQVKSATTNSCSTGGNSYSTCTLVGSWSSAFAGTPHASCTLITASDPRACLGAISAISSSGIQVTLITGGSQSVTGSAECVGVVD